MCHALTEKGTAEYTVPLEQFRPLARGLSALSLSERCPSDEPQHTYDSCIEQSEQPSHLMKYELSEF
ncbi:MAG: hypothetical protein K2Y08_00570 [Alphaproteobacteria bacterium]|nr:hypothetical protein [Alphaproteobacteria bacterium]